MENKNSISSTPPLITTATSEFQILKKLGQGSFSEVYKIQNIKNKKQYAMKRIKLNSLKPKQRENAVNQIRFLASIRCSYIISYKEAIFEQISNTLCIIMQYAGGSDLLHKIQNLQKKNVFLQEKVIWAYAIQMILALQTLHDHSIVHRDLKSANIFLSKDHRQIKMGDLNVSKLAKDVMLKTQTGTPYYASPEIWRDVPYNFQSDIWSLGCVIYEMACLEPPFKGTDMDNLYKKVVKGSYEPIPTIYSYDLQCLISNTLQISPKLRLSCDQLLALPSVKQWIDILETSSNPIKVPQQETQPFNYDLLQTIKFQKNFQGLQENLPTANYDESSAVTNDQNSCGSNGNKANTFQTLLSQNVTSPKLKPYDQYKDGKTQITEGNNLIQMKMNTPKPEPSSQQNPFYSYNTTPVKRKKYKLKKKAYLKPQISKTLSSPFFSKISNVREIIDRVEKLNYPEQNHNYFADNSKDSNSDNLLSHREKQLIKKPSNNNNSNSSNVIIPIRSRSIDYLSADSKQNDILFNNNSPNMALRLPFLQKELLNKQNNSSLNINNGIRQSYEKDHSNNKSVITGQDRLRTQSEDQDILHNNQQEGYFLNEYGQFQQENPYGVQIGKYAAIKGRPNSRNSMDIVKAARKEV